MCASRYLQAFGVCFLLTVAVIESAEECIKSQCKGPLRMYHELKCKPVYEDEGDCCAIRYDCHHLKERSTSKCYSNGQEYAVGEELRDEDRPTGCDRCTCIADIDTGEVNFVCAVHDCFDVIPKPGCYLRFNHDTCCFGIEVCPKRGDVVPRCRVDGRTYRDGQEFTLKDDPLSTCYCMEGYKGENIAPFCKKKSCGTELRHSREIRENCVPMFYYIQNPKTDCSYDFKCPNDDDHVVYAIKQSLQSYEKKVSDDMTCKFGNLSIRVGDELKHGNKHKTSCMKCVCEVPPIPTCTRMANEKCGDNF